MRVFVTGASGWIGSAVIPELLAAGHEVTGLARSDAAAAAVEAAGAAVCRGTIDDLDTLRTQAEASDGVIHLAFKHDIAFSGGFRAAADAERRAIDAFAEALSGSGRPLVIASGTVWAAPGRVATERDGHGLLANGSGARIDGADVRQANAEITLGLAEKGVRAAVLRLPPTVHGDGDHGFMAALIGIARRTGLAGYLGEGSNRWPAVHRLDAAHLFRLALEKAPAGSTLHAVADEGVPIRAIAEAIGRHLGIPVAPVAPENAGAHFAWLAGLLAMDSPASSALTREMLGWEPTHPGLIEDLDLGHYFRQPTV